MMKTLDPGDAAPDFSVAIADDETKGLADYKGEALVLYFYPKDMTPGCTTEAIAFSELAPKFKRAGAAVLGVSRDSLARHEKFRDKHDLKIDLGADEDGSVCEAYGVWVEKKMYGKTFMGIERSTFLIDADGQIAEIWRKVKVKGHAEAVLDAAKAL